LRTRVEKEAAQQKDAVDREGVAVRDPFPSAVNHGTTGNETQNHGRWNEWEGT
jgi:hypothetical protein